MTLGRYGDVLKMVGAVSTARSSSLRSRLDSSTLLGNIIVAGSDSLFRFSGLYGDQLQNTPSMNNFTTRHTKTVDTSTLQVTLAVFEVL